MLITFFEIDISLYFEYWRKKLKYRNWVIINLLLNNGCRAATIRNIKIKDLDLENRVIYLRHTKNKRSQVIPLCESLCIKRIRKIYSSYNT